MYICLNMYGQYKYEQLTLYHDSKEKMMYDHTVNECLHDIFSNNSARLIELFLNHLIGRYLCHGDALS